MILLRTCYLESKRWFWRWIRYMPVLEGIPVLHRCCVRYGNCADEKGVTSNSDPMLDMPG